MISVIITNYKTWQLTEKCIEACRQFDDQKQILEYIVVDDASGENIPEILAKSEDVKIITNPVNRGYASCVNIGFINAGQEICLLLDSDAFPMSKLSVIVQHFTDQTDLGVLGFQLVDLQKNPTGKSEPEPNFWSVLLGQQLFQKFGKWIRNKEMDGIVVYSCAMAVRKKAFDTVKGFDESFDFLDADLDFSMKINRSVTWKVRLAEEVIMYHEGGGSPQLTSKRVLRYYVNRFKLLRKYSLLPRPFLIKTGIYLRVSFEWLLIALTGKRKYSSEVYEDKLYSRKILIQKIFSL
jgi:hypothetical protein